MKKILLSLLVILLCLVIPSETTSAAVKISKTMATMEVDSTLELKISGSKEKISWKSNKKSVATVNSGTIVARSEGQATITATINSKKYNCIVTVVNSNKKISINNTEELEDYFSDKYSSIITDMGKIKFEYSVYENSSSIMPYDYTIRVEWDGIEPYDIQYSKSYSKNEKDSTINTLKEMQLNIYNDFITFFPGKKVSGGYITSWYEYPTIQVGYKSIRFLSWQNYKDSGDINSYKSSKLDKFQWTPLYDDYDFTK